MIIIDGHYFLHRCMFVDELVNMRSPDGFPVGGIYGFINSIKGVREKYPSHNRMVVVWDSGRSKRRMEQFPEYKSHRSSGNEPEDIFRRNLFTHQLDVLKNVLPYLGVRQVVLPEREGDDLISLLCDMYDKKDKTNPILIATDDKDVLQLVSGSISVFRPCKEVEVNANNFKELTGVSTPEMFILYLSITGDKSDNIPGVESVGEKTAKSVLEIMDRQSDSLGLIDRVNQACLSFPRLKTGEISKRVQSLLEGGDTIVRNYSMIDLSLEEFDSKDMDIVIDFVEGKSPRFLKDNVMGIFSKFGFNSFIPIFHQFERLFSLLS